MLFIYHRANPSKVVNAFSHLVNSTLGHKTIHLLLLAARSAVRCYKQAVHLQKWGKELDLIIDNYVDTPG